MPVHHSHRRYELVVEIPAHRSRTSLAPSPGSRYTSSMPVDTGVQGEEDQAPKPTPCVTRPVGQHVVQSRALSVPRSPSSIMKDVKVKGKDRYAPRGKKRVSFARGLTRSPSAGPSGEMHDPLQAGRETIVDCFAIAGDIALGTSAGTSTTPSAAGVNARANSGAAAAPDGHLLQGLGQLAIAAGFVAEDGAAMELLPDGTARAVIELCAGTTTAAGSGDVKPKMDQVEGHDESEVEDEMDVAKTIQNPLDESACGICYEDMGDIVGAAEKEGKGGLAGDLALYACELRDCGAGRSGDFLHPYPQACVWFVEQGPEVTVVFCVKCVVDWTNRRHEQGQKATCPHCTRRLDLAALRKQAVALDPAMVITNQRRRAHVPPQAIEVIRNILLWYEFFQADPQFANVIHQPQGAAVWRQFFIERAYAHLTPEIRARDAATIDAATIDGIADLAQAIFAREFVRAQIERDIDLDRQARGEGHLPPVQAAPALPALGRLGALEVAGAQGPALEGMLHLAPRPPNGLRATANGQVRPGRVGPELQAVHRERAELVRQLGNPQLPAGPPEPALQQDGLAPLFLRIDDRPIDPANGILNRTELQHLAGLPDPVRRNALQTFYTALERQRRRTGTTVDQLLRAARQDIARLTELMGERRPAPMAAPARHLNDPFAPIAPAAHPPGHHAIRPAPYVVPPREWRLQARVEAAQRNAARQHAFPIARQGVHAAILGDRHAEIRALRVRQRSRSSSRASSNAPVVQAA